MLSMVQTLLFKLEKNTKLKRQRFSSLALFQNQPSATYAF